MENQTVLVVGETPSLGQSIVDLLESGNVPTRFVHDVTTQAPLSSLFERFPLVIAASNRYVCATARRWSRGEFPDVVMVVVGARDPALTDMRGVRVVPLPLLPGPLLALVRSLTFPPKVGGPPSRPRIGDQRPEVPPHAR
jgi:hypothetical protein